MPEGPGKCGPSDPLKRGQFAVKAMKFSRKRAEFSWVRLPPPAPPVFAVRFGLVPFFPFAGTRVHPPQSHRRSPDTVHRKRSAGTRIAGYERAQLLLQPRRRTPEPLA